MYLSFLVAFLAEMIRMVSSRCPVYSILFVAGRGNIPIAERILHKLVGFLPLKVLTLDDLLKLFNLLFLNECLPVIIYYRGSVERVNEAVDEFFLVPQLDARTNSFVRIPVDRERGFWFIVNTDSGRRRDSINSRSSSASLW